MRLCTAWGTSLELFANNESATIKWLTKILFKPLFAWKKVLRTVFDVWRLAEQYINSLSLCSLSFILEGYAKYVQISVDVMKAVSIWNWAERLGARLSIWAHITTNGLRLDDKHDLHLSVLKTDQSESNRRSKQSCCYSQTRQYGPWSGHHKKCPY